MTPQERAALEKAQHDAEVARKAAEERPRRPADQARRPSSRRRYWPTSPPAAEAAAPAINYKFIGYFGPSENKIAILNDGTDLIFVRQGEKLGGQFKILEIGYESVKFGYTDPKFKGETTTLR